MNTPRAKLGKRSLYLVLLLAALVVAGCGPQGESGAAITAPADGAQLTAGELVTVRTRVGFPSGAASAFLFVNEEIARQDALNVPLYSGEMLQGWRPPGPGTYSLQVLFTSAEGENLTSNTITVFVGGEAPTAEAAPSEEPTPGETVTTEPQGPIATADLDVNCRLGPDPAYEAIGVHAQGQSAPIVGRNPSNSWWVIERAGGNCWVWDGGVSVSGDTSQVPIVEPPPFPTETTAPIPAPSPIGPSGAQSCTSSVFLEWSPVTDPVIDHYEWRVEDGGVQTGSTNSTTVEVFISCGTSYTWQVRAVDGEGNAGPYSSPMAFSIN